MNEVVIIGAGVAGLSAANYLVDHGIKPIIIDADSIGRTKVCGEFFSYEAILFLQDWDIPYLLVENANFFTKSNNYSFTFPKPAASTLRSECELKLSERAVSLGAELFINKYVEDIIWAKFDDDVHNILLSSGEIFEANKLVIASGRLPFLNNNIKKDPNYIGIKSHFTNIHIPNELYMFMAPGAYMGVTYVTESIVNVCCLAKKSLVDSFTSIDDFMQHFINSNKHSKQIFKYAEQLHTPWLTAYVSNFGKKINPEFHNTYFIGDAAATIHPASGNGLTMGLTSGVMAAQHIINNTQNDFKKDWDSKYAKRLKYANLLHSIFISSYKASLGFKLANLFPCVSNSLYRFTR